MTTTLIGGDLLTGLVRVRNIPARAATVTTGIESASLNMTVRLPAIDPTTGRVLDIAEQLVPGKSFIGFVQDGEIVDAGPLWVDEFTFDTRQHLMQATGLEGYFDYRYVVPLLDPGQPHADVTSEFTGVSLRTQAKRLVELCQEWTPTLPLVFEDDEAGSSVRTYPGSDLMRVRDALRNLSGVIGGPEIRFRPRFKVTGGGIDRQYVEWELVTGDPLLIQAGQPHVWDASVIGSRVKGAKLRRDATALATDAFVNGATILIEEEVEGEPLSTSELLAATATDDTLLDAGFPRMQSAQTRYSVIEQSTLQSHADGDVALGRFMLETWQFQARKDSTPTLGTYRPGDMARLVIGPNGRIAPGSYPVRIVEIQATLGPWVTITCAPERVEP